MRNMAWKLAPDPFIFQRIICKREFEEVCKLIWTSFGSFTITYKV